MEFYKSQDLQIRASSGIVKDYNVNVQENNIHEPPHDYNILWDMVEADGLLAAAIDTTVDVATMNGYQFIPKDKNDKETENEIKRANEIFDDILDFDQVVDNIIYSACIYGDAFMELRRMDGEIKEIHPLETTEMKIRYDIHGHVLGYIQRPSFDPTGLKDVPFQIDEIIHFRMKWVGSSVYSKTPLLPIARDYTTKQYARSYLTNIFVNFPPRLVYILKSHNEEDVNKFISVLRTVKRTYNQTDVLAYGDVEIKEVGNSQVFTQGLLDILNYLRQEILTITKVPPLWLGFPADSNRSSAEAQLLSFETRIKKIQQKIESPVNKILLPALGFNKIKFKFIQSTLKGMDEILDIAVKMRAIGLDEDTILKFLYENGLRLREGAKIVANAAIKNYQPSRDRKKGDMPENNMRGGASQEAERKLEVRSTTTLPNLREYPYTY